MSNIVEIDITSSDYLFEVYNKNKISRELIKYLIDSVPYNKRKEEFKIVINNKLKNHISCAELIKNALDLELKSNDFKFLKNNMKQISFFVIGVLALIISNWINIDIFKEIMLIGAWVLLWDMVEMEIEDDLNNRKKKKIIKKILASEFIENKE